MSLETYSLYELQQINYRELQKQCKALRLPANLKKIYLANLIYTKYNGTSQELELIIDRAKTERLLAAQSNKKKGGRVTKKARSNARYQSGHLQPVRNSNLHQQPSTQISSTPVLLATPTRKTDMRPTSLNMQLPDRVLRNHNVPKRYHHNQIDSKRSLITNKGNSIELNKNRMKCVGFIQENIIRRAPLLEFREQLKSLQPIILANRNTLQMQSKNKTAKFELLLKPMTSNLNSSVPERLNISDVSNRVITRKTTVLPATVQRHMQRSKDSDRSLLNQKWKSLVQKDNITGYSNTNMNGREDSSNTDDENDSNDGPNTNMSNYPNLRAASEASDDNFTLPPVPPMIQNEPTSIININLSIATPSGAVQCTPVRLSATFEEKQLTSGAVQCTPVRLSATFQEKQLTPVTTLRRILAPVLKSNIEKLGAYYNYEKEHSTERNATIVWKLTKQINDSMYTGTLSTYVLPTHTPPYRGIMHPGFSNGNKSNCPNHYFLTQECFWCYQLMDINRASHKSLSQVTNIVEVDDDDDMSSALEIITGDGDYVSRLGMNCKVECFFCSWEAQMIHLDNHLRKEHAEIITKQNNDEWVISFNLEKLIHEDEWHPMLVEDRSGFLYIVSGKFEESNCVLFAIAAVDAEQCKIDYSITSYNKKTTDAVVWDSGKVKDFNDVHRDTTNNVKIELSKLGIAPNLDIIICSPTSPLADSEVNIILYVRLS